MELSLVNLLLVLLVAWLAGRLASRFGYPSVLGELLAGIVLGPPLLGLLEGGEALAVLAEVGILVMMLYIGMEIDPAELKKASKGGILAALGGFITPFVLCYLLVVGLGGTVMAGIFVGIAAGVTSLATKSRILVDLQLLDTRIAHVMMAGALVADTLSLVLFAAILGVGEVGGLDLGGLAVVAFKAIGYFALATAVGVWGLPWLSERLGSMARLGRTGAFMLILILALVFAEGAHLAGMHGILGAFLAGLFLRENVLGGRTQAKELMHAVREASLGFLAPIFFVTAGFAVSLDVFTTDLGLLVAVIGLATVGKVIGTALFYLPTGHGWREGLTIGAGMNGRGAVEIIVAQIGLSAGLISQEIFSILVFMAIATTATVPIFLKWGVDWLRRRGDLVRTAEDRPGVVVVGAGPTARAMGQVLARSQPVTLVDRNVYNLRAAEDDGLHVIQGNALEEEVLAEAGAATARYLVAMTGNAEVDALVAQQARVVFHVPDVLVLQGGTTDGHRTLLEHMGGSTLFAGPTLLADWDYRVDHAQVERKGLPVEQAWVAEKLVQQLQQPRPSLPLAMRRADLYMPVHSGLTLQPDDRLVLLQVPEQRLEPFDPFDRLVHHAPILDVEHALALPAFFDLAAAALAPQLGMEPDELAEALQARETASSTVLLPGLAIPHVMLEGEGQFEILLARSRDGIAFPGHSERVHAAFVLVGTADQRNLHLRVLSAIAQTVQWPDFEQSWLTAADPEALRRLVLSSTRRRFRDDQSGEAASDTASIDSAAIHPTDTDPTDTDPSGMGPIEPDGSDNGPLVLR